MMQQSEAERKFWETPELLETLFLSLDLQSSLSLARLLDQENLQRSMTSKVWSKLVSQNCPSVERGLLLGGMMLRETSWFSQYLACWFPSPGGS